MAEKKEKESKPQAGIARRDPLRELREWRPHREWGLFPSRLEHLFGELESAWGRGAGSFGPPMDIAESEDRYTVTVELPGTRKEDVTVELEDGQLTIRGEKRSEHEEKKEHRRYVERSFGSFCRSFPLPPNADPQKLEASFEDGVLSLVIAKSEAAKAKTIAIK